MTRLKDLRSRLQLPGTPMRDVPPDARGLTFHEWVELLCLEYREDTPQNPQETAVAVSAAPERQLHLVSSARCRRAP
jgi:hypothetical protein